MAVEFDLGTRYRPAGKALVTGVQAIARLLVEQHAADAAAGLRTASFVSGYQGSPLGGLDTTLAGLPELADTAGLVFRPGLNEELAATAVWGSQVEVPGHERTVDGAVGVWYGKAPGVDRAGDPMRHGNICGAHPRGGVLVLAGDDPGCKSSTIPCVSERTLAGYGLPVLYPADAADVVRLGRYGIALSRASGMWVGMKITADVADGLYSLDDVDVDITVPRTDWEYRQYPMLAPPASLEAEQQLYGPRWDMVRAFLAANPLDSVEDLGSARVGVIAGGKAYTDVRQALRDLGVESGVRLLKLGAIHPLDAGRVREFAEGLDTILVVEEKGAFIESAVRDVLYDAPHRPRVRGADVVPQAGELTPAALAAPLRQVLGLPATRALPPLELLPVARTPYFCSGCPHNRSTVVPAGAVAGGGIGCHAMVALTHRESSEVTSITQMGGEGAQWIGQAPFTAAEHMFQNIGDGTFAHSGQLAVQACVAAGATITYKLLYNRAVAMTGGQDAEGGLEVPALAAKLLAEGVARVLVCADEPGRYRLPKGVDLWHRDRLDEAHRVLAATPGVTVLIYDQRCAAESRRLRKRGELPVRPMRVVVNEAVCEGCGDCGVKSNCLSVQPVETELGRKTRIDQTTCNTDYSCLDGDCPSFVTVEAPVGSASSRPARREPPAVPDVVVPGSGEVFLAGIGGTGIVTVNQVLGSAAVREGKAVQGVDQTGLSQKAGPVVSHLRIGELGPSVRVGTADCYLAFDALVGADARFLAYAGPSTTAVVSTSRVPTGAQVRDVAASSVSPEALLERIGSRSAAVVSLDAQAAAEALFGDAMPANLLLVGAAYQAGVLPLSAEAIEWAIALNGVAVEVNIAAFRWGRVAVADPSALPGASAPPAGPRSSGLDLGPLDGAVRELVDHRAALLVDYQSRRTAQAYVADVVTVWRAERALGSETRFAAAVARGLHRLTAYKDEYEVARLLTDPVFEARLAAEVPGGTRMRYRLHPPVLKALGRRSKIAFGPWMRPVLRQLARGRVLRGTPLDPFGRTAVRRLERALRDEYRDMVLDLARGLTADSYERAVAAAEAAEEIRGYEDVKLAGVARYRARLAALRVEAPS